MKVAIIGAAGRMGQALVRCAKRMKDIEIVAAIDQHGDASIGQDAGVVAGIDEIGVKISDDPKAAEFAEVMIDFSFHAALPRNARTALDLRMPMVVGITALDESEREALLKTAAQVPVVFAPNMSLGVNVLFAVLKKAAAVLGDDYQVELDETHHVHKKDSPSGTALRLAEKVAEGRGQDLKKVMVHEEIKNDLDREAELEEEDKGYPEGSIVIRSYREDEVVGDHSISFANEGETIEFTHHAWSRDAFAMGALRAAKWVTTRRPGLYDMQDVLGL